MDSPESHALYPDLEGKVAVVTGAASGIGRSVVDRLLANGCHVVGIDQTAVDTGTNDQWLSIQADISDEAACADAFRTATDKYAKIPLLVHSAGILRKSPLTDLTTDEFDQVIRVNLRGSMLVLRAGLRHMAGHGGAASIVCVTSLAAHRTGIGLAAYSAAKRGMMALVAAAATENGPHIRVNTVAPGLIDTPMQRQHDEAAQQVAAGRAARTPLGRLGTSDEVAAAVHWLLSDEARFVTGSAFVVDGGALSSAG